MGGLELSLAAAALLIGATGTFSPCGFSAIETLGPTGHTGGRRTTIAAVIAFAPGAILGGVFTFGALALLGELIGGAGGRAAYLVAAAIAIVAAVLEARGTRIVPQIRRQLPEHWRRVMPMPLAGGLYGVLLGMGFTTFVLSFGVWALAGISLAVGDPAVGVLLGAAFGVGRAVPVVVLAPLAGTPAGARATDLMAASPAAYLGIRRGDAAALAIAALALVLSVGNAGAASTVVPDAADPSLSASDGALAFETEDGRGVLREAGADRPLPGADPAVSSTLVAVRDGDEIKLLARGSLAQVGAPIPAPGADAIALSPGWLAYRVRSDDRDRILVRSLADPAAPGPELLIDTAGDPNQLSPPSLAGDTLVYAKARRKGSRIVGYELPSGGKSTLRRADEGLVFNPSAFDGRLAYVEVRTKTASIRIRDLDGKDRGSTVISRKRSRGLLWSTALGAGELYATILEPGTSAAQAEIVREEIRGGKR
jgi:hypothetical protein